MRANRSCAAFVLVAMAAGCGGSEEGGDDLPTGREDAGPRDAAIDAAGTQTDVTGTLDGDTFRLRYAAVSWGTSLHTVCAATVPIDADDCTMNDGASKTLFVGRFYFDDQGVEQWAFPLELRRFGASPAGELSGEGSLDISIFTPETSRLSLTLSTTFKSGALSGRIVVNGS